MEISVVGMIRRIETSCACGEETNIGKLCPKCKTLVMCVITIKQVELIEEGRTTTSGFHVTDTLYDKRK